MSYLPQNKIHFSRSKITSIFFWQLSICDLSFSDATLSVNKNTYISFEASDILQAQLFVFLFNLKYV